MKIEDVCAWYFGITSIIFLRLIYKTIARWINKEESPKE
jgi:hypothetical protein